MLSVERVDGDQKDDLNSVELTLPSKGVDYPSAAQGPFSVRPPRVREVEFLAGMNKNNYDEQLTRLLRSLITKPVIDPADLTLGDRQYLHVWVRAQIDPVYRFKAECAHCRAVDDDYHLEISKIPLIEVPEQYTPNMRLTLPRSKKVVTVRLETARDRDAAAKLEAAGVPQWTARKAMVITTVDGTPMTNEQRCEWLRGLPGGDDMFLAHYLKWQHHGPDFANCPFRCKSCQKESTIRMPFRLEFYLPTLHAAAAFGDAVGGGVAVAGGNLSGDAGGRGDGVREIRLGAEPAARTP